MSVFPSKLAVILTAIASFIATALIAYGLHSWSVNQINADHISALVKQKNELQVKCLLEKKLPNEVSYAYQNELTSIDNLYAAADRMRPYCVPVASNSTGGYNAATPGKELPAGNGIGSRFVLDFARRCEKPEFN